MTIIANPFTANFLNVIYIYIIYIYIYILYIYIYIIYIYIYIYIYIHCGSLSYVSLALLLYILSSLIELAYYSIYTILHY